MTRISRRLSVVCFAVILLMPAPARAQEAAYADIVDRFFALVQAGQTDEAVEFLYSSNPWMQRAADAVEQVRAQLKGLPTLVGQLQGFELLQTKTLGTRFVYLSYMALYDRQPIRFIFEFYRPAEEWMTFGFSFDQDLDDDVEAAARLELGRPQ